jgi:hypothetical protein
MQQLCTSVQQSTPQQQQCLQELEQQMQRSLQENDKTLEALPRLPTVQQLPLMHLLLQQREQTLLMWQVLLDMQQPLPDSLRQLLSQQEELRKLTDPLPLSLENLQFKQTVLQRQQQMLQQWQQLPGDLQEQQRLLGQQQRALEQAAEVYVQFNTDPIAAIMGHKQITTADVKLEDLQRKLWMYLGWMDVFREDAAQQQQQQQQEAAAKTGADE